MIMICHLLIRMYLIHEVVCAGNSYHAYIVALDILVKFDINKIYRFLMVYHVR